MKLWKYLLYAVVSVAFMTVAANAAIYTEEWTSSISGWKIKSLDEGAASGAISWSSGSPWDGRDEILRIEASTGGGISQDIIYADATSSGGNLAGNKVYDAAEYIQFDFYANMAPVSLNAYFKGDGVIWLNEITSVTVGSWDTYQIPLSFGYGTGWYRVDGTGGTQAAFNSSVADVDEIGIMIQYQSSTAGQDYGLDGFSVIPEPQTWLMLGFALCSLAVTFRRQLNETLATVAVRMHTCPK